MMKTIKQEREEERQGKKIMKKIKQLIKTSKCNCDICEFLRKELE